MIRETKAMLYCCEDISKIENYELAVNDKEQVWHCHHRGEILPCGRYSMDSLKKFGLYWNRPASELIFLTRSEHRRLHGRVMGFPGGCGSQYWKGKHLPSEVKNKMSAAKKGKKKSENHKKCISDAIRMWWEKRKEKTLKV